MVTVKQGVGSSLLVYKDHVYVGTLNLTKEANRLVYQAITKQGSILGSSPVYGSALALLVGKPFIKL